MGKEITHECCSNSRKIVLWGKIPGSKFSFIVLYQKTITRNLESASFTKLLKSLLTLGFERNQTNLDYVFRVTSYGGLRKIPSYRFCVKGKKTITWNSEFSPPSISPRVIIKFRVIVFMSRVKITRNSVR